MGALPKNKITRAERGKRRAGNTPNLTKDINSNTVPLHKQSLSNAMLADMGFSQEKANRTVHKRRSRDNASRLEQLPADNAQPASTRSNVSNQHRAQHKG